MEIEEGKGVSHQKRVMRKIPLFDIPQKVHIFSFKNVLIYLYVICKKLCTKISGKHAVLINILLPKIGFPSPGMKISETSPTNFSWSPSSVTQKLTMVCISLFNSISVKYSISAFSTENKMSITRALWLWLLELCDFFLVASMLKVNIWNSYDPYEWFLEWDPI